MKEVGKPGNEANITLVGIAPSSLTVHVGA